MKLTVFDGKSKQKIEIWRTEKLAVETLNQKARIETLEDKKAQSWNFKPKKLGFEGSKTKKLSWNYKNKKAQIRLRFKFSG